MFQTAQALLQGPSLSNICQIVGISRNTLYRYLTPEGELP